MNPFKQKVPVYFFALMALAFNTDAIPYTSNDYLKVTKLTSSIPNSPSNLQAMCCVALDNHELSH